jgi:hypothetical protein
MQEPKEDGKVSETDTPRIKLDEMEHGIPLTINSDLHHLLGALRSHGNLRSAGTIGVAIHHIEQLEADLAAERRELSHLKACNASWQDRVSEERTRHDNDLAAANARVAAMEQECQRMREELETVEAIAHAAPELNPRNYSHEEACQLNTAMCELYVLVSEYEKKAAIEAAGGEK